MLLNLLRHRSWTERKRWKIRLFVSISAVICSIIALVSSHLYKYHLDSLTSAAALKWLDNKLGFVGIVLTVPYVRDFLQSHTEALVSGFGLVAGGITAALCRSWVHDRFLITFNDDVLAPIDSLHIDRDRTEEKFVQLDWILGDIGPRRAAWDTLEQWCRGRASSLATNHDGPRRALAVLVGRAGSGKSRMAHRLARHLARRDLLGGESPKAAMLWRVRVYLRRTMPLMRPRPHDPWDAGLLDRRENDTSFEQVCMRLSKWQPRRSTILVLDDPLPRWSSMARIALTTADETRPFRHAVCLLVVNQTVPIDTGIEFKEESGSWMFEKKPLTPQPVRLPIEAWFTPEETLKAAFGSGHIHGKPLEVQKAVRQQLYEITRGNPLLVVLAIEWIRDDHPIAEMTAGELTKRRAERIIDGLENSGIRSASQFTGLALATLVGGAPGDSIEAASKTIYSNPTPLPSGSELQACFPTEPLGTGGSLRIPPVRPDIVADAFVGAVLMKIGLDRADAMAEAAFRIDAAAVLRGVRRTHPQNSPMTRALLAVASDPSRVAGLDPVELALALADIAAICQTEDRPLSTADSRSEALNAATVAVERLGPEQRIVFCRRLAERCDITPDERSLRQLRPAAMMQLVLAAADGVALSIDVLIRCFSVLKERAVGPIEAWGKLAVTALLIDADDVSRHVAASAWDVGHAWRPSMAPFLSTLARSSRQRGSSALAHYLDAMAAATDPRKVKSAADSVETLAIGCWADLDWQRVSAVTRGLEAYACCQNPEVTGPLRTRSAAAAVAAIAQRFGVDPVVQLEAVKACHSEALAWSQIPLGAKAPAVSVAADAAWQIASRFFDNAAIHKWAAEARCLEAFAWCQVPRGSKASASGAAADTVWRIASHFVGDSAIQRAAAEARCCEANAWSELPLGAGASEAHVAANAVWQIATRFHDDPAIHKEAAEARRYEAFAWAEVPLGARASAAGVAADTVWQIAARFPDDIFIQKEAAKARRNEAFAQCQVPLGAGALAASAAADTVWQIAARFLDDADISKEAAECWRHEASAWCRVPCGAKAASAAVAADKVTEIAAQFRDNAAIQTEAAEGGRCEAFAWSRVPLGARASAAGTAANRVKEIAARFPDDLNIQRVAQLASRYADEAVATYSAASAIAAAPGT